MTTKVKSAIWGKGAKKVGKTPAIVLLNPKFARNVGVAVRAASCYSFKQVWFTGDRLEQDPHLKKRLPREERMKGYRSVEIIHYDRPFERFPKGVTPVAIEVRANAEPLFSFVHPENPVYIFGPEDGSISGTNLAHCHRFVVIPTKHCLNLAVAIGTVLYDRAQKEWLKTGESPITPGEWEQRGRIEVINDVGVPF